MEEGAECEPNQGGRNPSPWRVRKTMVGIEILKKKKKKKKPPEGHGTGRGEPLAAPTDSLPALPCEATLAATQGWGEGQGS